MVQVVELVPTYILPQIGSIAVYFEHRFLPCVNSIYLFISHGSTCECYSVSGTHIDLFLYKNSETRNKKERMDLRSAS